MVAHAASNGWTTGVFAGHQILVWIIKERKSSNFFSLSTSIIWEPTSYPSDSLWSFISGEFHNSIHVNIWKASHLSLGVWLFGISIAFIYAIANEVVNALTAIGLTFNLSEMILGMTILAWGNCLESELFAVIRLLILDF